MPESLSGAQPGEVNSAEGGVTPPGAASVLLPDAAPGVPYPGAGLPDQANSVEPTTQQVVATYRDMVFAIALTHTECLGDAEDAFQETFLVYHRKRPSFNGDEHCKAWLIRTALNCSRQIASSSWRRRTEALGDADLAVADDFRFATETQDAVFRALKQVPEDYRAALHLFYFDDLPVAKIAVLLDISEAAVKMRLSRGRRLMRAQLEGGIFND
ncbi:MAG: sigma-70 family RNA polymerase sigma factor [Bifidobacteriaceae bacterium]|jgi:RNA polymerase sigma-70 factor (ECF subfamily)|nr:sigma-70 family RNA polymerase sigma factor [Bifidobacteriaceae bacterium]